MLYRNDRYSNPISALGYGCMRFSRKGAGIDIEKAKKEISIAYEGGVNYYDTAYIYPGSEAALGRILEELGIRDKVNIATKLPHYLMRSRAQMDSTLEEELKRLRTDHIDYYLMHMVTDLGSFEKLKSYGFEEWAKEKKASGKVKQIGFSFHGASDEFLKILDAWDWDFCQIQYNYMDENAQAGRAGLMAAAAKGIPVIIMEPLRGGRLVNLLPEEAKAAFASSGRNYTPAEWGLRWLYDQPEVTCVLSGMNSEDMVRENLRVASKTGPGSLTEEDRAVIARAKDAIESKLLVKCTGCGYCMPCPHGVDIPNTFRCYNETSIASVKSGRTDYFRATVLRHVPTSASLCVKCGACEKHCPQGIPIREKLAEAAGALETPFYKGARALVKGLHLWGA